MGRSRLVPMGERGTDFSVTSFDFTNVGSTGQQSQVGFSFLMFHVKQLPTDTGGANG